MCGDACWVNAREPQLGVWCPRRISISALTPLCCVFAPSYERQVSFLPGSTKSSWIVIDHGNNNLNDEGCNTGIELSRREVSCGVCSAVGSISFMILCDSQSMDVGVNVFGDGSTVAGAPSSSAVAVTALALSIVSIVLVIVIAIVGMRRSQGVQAA